jgi:hypothetical protein
MYEFATVALLGLAVAAVVSLIGHLRSVSRTAALALALLVGLGLSWATDYSAFAGWGIHFRALWMGPVATGLVIGAVAIAWSEILAAFTAYAVRRGQASPADSTVSRVA